MKRFAGRASIIRGATALVLLGGFLAFPGCRVTMTDGTDDGTDEGNSGAWVEFPDDPDVLMTIDEDDGIGSAVFRGYYTGDGEDAVVTGLEFDTGEGTATVSVDGEGRPTRVAIGSAMLDMQYNADGSFNYQLYENGQLLYEGDNVTPETTNAKTSVGLTLRITEADFVDCVTRKMHDWAARIAASRLGLRQDTISSDNPLAECLKNSNVVWGLARVSCVTAIRVADRVAALREPGSPLYGVVGRAIMAVALYSVLLSVEEGVDAALSDIADQMWSNPNCRFECTNNDHCDPGMVCEQFTCLWYDGDTGNGNADADVSVTDLAGCWSLDGSLRSTSSDESTSLGGSMIFQFDSQGQLQGLWLYFSTPNPDGILYQEFARFTIPNAGLWDDAITFANSDVSVFAGGTNAYIKYTFTAYMIENCVVRTEVQSTYDFEIDNAVLSGNPPQSFASQNVIYTIRTTTRDPETGETSSASDTQVGNVTGTRVSCPDLSLPEVQRQEDFCN